MWFPFFLLTLHPKNIDVTNHQSRTLKIFGIMKNQIISGLHRMRYIISAFLLTMMLVCNWGCEETPRQRGGRQTATADAQKSVKDTAQKSDEMTEEEKKEAEKAQHIEACKTFLKNFYEEAEQNYYDDDFIRSNITPKAEKYLVDHYDLECLSHKCMATWLFYQEGSVDVGSLMECIVDAIDENTYRVTCVSSYMSGEYQEYRYTLVIGIVKEGDSFKIDSLKTESSECI